MSHHRARSLPSSQTSLPASASSPAPTNPACCPTGNTGPSDLPLPLNCCPLARHTGLPAPSRLPAPKASLPFSLGTQLDHVSGSHRDWVSDRNVGGNNGGCPQALPESTHWPSSQHIPLHSWPGCETPDLRAEANSTPKPKDRGAGELPGCAGRLMPGGTFSITVTPEEPGSRRTGAGAGMCRADR